MSQRSCFIFQPIFLHFSGVLAYQRPIWLQDPIKKPYKHLGEADHFSCLKFRSRTSRS